MTNKSILTIILTLCLFSCQQEKSIQRDFDFNTDWQFHLSNQELQETDELSFEDWAKVILPHNWVSNTDEASVNIKACDASLLPQIGLYKKVFLVNKEADEQVFIYFEAVNNISEYWLNGHKVGMHTDGRFPFYFDITDYLLPNESENELLAKLYHREIKDTCSVVSGIIGNVHLVKVNRLHIPIEGTFISTPKVASDYATFSVSIILDNDYEYHKTADIITEIYGPNGKLLQSVDSNSYMCKPGVSSFSQQIKLGLKSIKNRNIEGFYSAKTKVYTSNKLVDVYCTNFNIAAE